MAYDCEYSGRDVSSIMADLSSASVAQSTVTRPESASEIRHWRLFWTQAMCEACLLRGFLDTPAWTAALGAICGGRFAGPGHPRVLALTLVPVLSVKSDERAVGRIHFATSAAVSMDSVTINHEKVHNLVAYTPQASLRAAGRLGAESPTRENLLGALKESLNQPICAAARRRSSPGVGTPGQIPRWRRLCKGPTPFVLSDSPSTILRAWNDGAADGTFAF